MSEFKNIPKNYSKAIINFIKKNRELARRVLVKIGEDYDEFMAAPKSLGGHVYTIAQLQWFWSGPNNPFAEAYRILSSEYLRKHSLGRSAFYWDFFIFYISGS
jgi:hypothetical protein